MLCESTYLEEHRHLAESHYHMTAKQAATQALAAGAQQLVLTHFSARYLNSKEFEIEAGKIFPNVTAAEEFRSYPFPKTLLLNKSLYKGYCRKVFRNIMVSAFYAFLDYLKI